MNSRFFIVFVSCVCVFTLPFIAYLDFLAKLLVLSVRRNKSNTARSLSYTGVSMLTIQTTPYIDYPA